MAPQSHCRCDKGWARGVMRPEVACAWVRCDCRHGGNVTLQVQADRPHPLPGFAPAFTQFHEHCLSDSNLQTFICCSSLSTNEGYRRRCLRWRCHCWHCRYAGKCVRGVRERGQAIFFPGCRFCHAGTQPRSPLSPSSPCPHLQVITNWIAICGLVGKVVSAWRRRKEQQPEKSESC